MEGEERNKIYFFMGQGGDMNKMQSRKAVLIQSEQFLIPMSIEFHPKDLEGILQRSRNQTFFRFLVWQLPHHLSEKVFKGQRKG